MSAFSDPQKNIEQCALQPGWVVADFGAGSGHHSLSAATAMVSTGTVYAIDVQKDLLARLQGEAREKNILNLEVIWGDVEKPRGTKLADSTVNLVIMSNLLFQIDNKKAVIDEAKRVLIPGGRVLVIDWAESFDGTGPRKKDIVTKDAALELFERFGFSKEREITAGEHHYGFIFKKL